MARLAKKLTPDDVVVELAGAKCQNFAFNKLGRTLRGRGSATVKKVPLPGNYLAFDFVKKQVRILEPLLYVETCPKFRDDAGAVIVLKGFEQPEYCYTALSEAEFVDLAGRVADLVATKEARLVQGKFPEPT